MAVPQITTLQRLKPLAVVESVMAGLKPGPPEKCFRFAQSGNRNSINHQFS
jgi:hypothetical protein